MRLKEGIISFVTKGYVNSMHFHPVIGTEMLHHFLTWIVELTPQIIKMKVPNSLASCPIIL